MGAGEAVTKTAPAPQPLDTIQVTAVSTQPPAPTLAWDVPLQEATTSSEGSVPLPLEQLVAQTDGVTVQAGPIPQTLEQLAAAAGIALGTEPSLMTPEQLVELAGGSSQHVGPHVFPPTPEDVVQAGPPGGGGKRGSKDK
ncbi:MAG: hypothetical protein ACFCVA_16555 [Gammaproteobacteria bacterium]